MNAQVTKKLVKYAQERMHIIVFNLIVLDGTNEVINQDFSIEFRTGDTPNSKIMEVKTKMQEAIDRYKSEQTIFNSTALNTAVINIQGGLVL